MSDNHCQILLPFPGGSTLDLSSQPPLASTDNSSLQAHRERAKARYDFIMDCFPALLLRKEAFKARAQISSISCKLVERSIAATRTFAVQACQPSYYLAHFMLCCHPSCFGCLAQRLEAGPHHDGIPSVTSICIFCVAIGVCLRRPTVAGARRDGPAQHPAPLRTHRRAEQRHGHGQGCGERQKCARRQEDRYREGFGAG